MRTLPSPDEPAHQEASQYRIRLHSGDERPDRSSRQEPVQGCHGNDDDRADAIGVWLLKTFMEKIRRRHTYRNSEPTTSLLTITSNVVYGEATGAMPNGRAAYTPFSPGASPSYGAETNGLVASLNSVAKIPYHWSLDGIFEHEVQNPPLYLTG